MSSGQPRPTDGAAISLLRLAFGAASIGREAGPDAAPLAAAEVEGFGPGRFGAIE